MIIIYIFFSVSRSQSQLRINYHSEQLRVINYLYFSGFRRTGNLRLLHSPYTAEAHARNGLEHRLAVTLLRSAYSYARVGTRNTLSHVVELESCHVVLIWRHNVGAYRITQFTHDNLRPGTYQITFRITSRAE